MLQLLNYIRPISGFTPFNGLAVIFTSDKKATVLDAGREPGVQSLGTLYVIALMVQATAPNKKIENPSRRTRTWGPE